MTNPPGFADLKISNAILAVLAKLNLIEPTPIQQKAIPAALAGQDVIGIAQTGTGKTLAFGIPAIEKILKTNQQTLIITPTRELALQVGESLRKVGQSLNIKVAVLIGGEIFDKQLFQLRRNPSIIVATPGRLIDHMKRRTFKISGINTLILDEADMMLDMGFAPQIKEILEAAPKNRQTMLFSATMPAEIVSMATKYLQTPISIETAPPGTTAALVDQEIFIIKNEERLDYLQKILQQYNGSVLVFVRTKHGVKLLTQKLVTSGHKAIEIHSNLTLNRRRRALDDFKSGRERILVATDVAARGLDINGIELVVNYNLPDSRDDYVHRIGRTARAGKSGKAISLATLAEQRMVYAIERLINKTIKKTDFARSKTVSTNDSVERTERNYQANRHRRPQSNRSGRPSQGNRSGQAGRSSKWTSRRPSYRTNKNAS
ncbi:MAG TPA: DEAD/DEAH box helicase [bacterium]|nr:DEAD/DEAH box helicase [bacterium]